jgi:hypothetical protein
MNNANQKTQDQVNRLLSKQKHGRKILRNCRKLCELQVQELRGDAGGEQPLRASSWQETSWKHMTGICKSSRFRCDGCMFDMNNPKTGNLLLKSWGWFSSRKDVHDTLNKICCHGSGCHDPIEGDITSGTAVYPRKLCDSFAKVLMKPRTQIHEIMSSMKHVPCFSNSHDHDDDENLDIFGDPVASQVDEPPLEESSEPPQDPVAAWGPDQIMHRLKTIHANLGHPSNTVLCRLLREAKAKDDIIQAAEKFECPFCRQRGHAASHRTSAVTQTHEKWEVVSTDTFWWYSPHKDGQGNPQVQALGISFLDETTDFHVATILRTGGKNLANINGKEFHKIFQTEWLKHYPKPKVIRFDDEGAFRDVANLEWLDGQGIKPEICAGEAAWQVGKQSRHVATLKESMSKLSLELGKDVSPEELLVLALSAKNRLHQTKGYSPNQWAFGVEKESLESWLQFGNHLPLQSRRENVLSFEENLQRIQKAKEAFLQADARRRILRAEKGKARKAETFQTGQLVYFYRKGRSGASNRHPGWYGPGRIVGVEKFGETDQNQVQGSIVWVAHGVTLYRCAPEQLRHVTQFVQNMADSLNNTTVFDEIRRAGNSSRYRDISHDMEQEPVDSEIHEEEPPQNTLAPGSSAPATVGDLVLQRARQKQPPRYVSQGQPGTDQEARGSQGSGATVREEGSSGPGDTSLSRDVTHCPGTGDTQGRGPQREDVQGGLQQAGQLRDLATPASAGERQVSQHPDLCPPGGRGIHRTRSSSGPSGEPTNKSEFWKHADAVRDRERMGRDLPSSSDGQIGRGTVSDGRHDENNDECLLRPQDSNGHSDAGQRSASGSTASELRSHHTDPAEPGAPGPSTQRVGEQGQPELRNQVSAQIIRNRSRSPHPTARSSGADGEIYLSHDPEYVENSEDDSDEHEDETVGNAHVDHERWVRKQDNFNIAQDLNLGFFTKASH